MKYKNSTTILTFTVELQLTSQELKAISDAVAVLRRYGESSEVMDDLQRMATSVLNREVTR